MKEKSVKSEDFHKAENLRLKIEELEAREEDEYRRRRQASLKKKVDFYESKFAKDCDILHGKQAQSITAFKAKRQKEL